MLGRRRTGERLARLLWLLVEVVAGLLGGGQFVVAWGLHLTNGGWLCGGRAIDACVLGRAGVGRRLEVGRTLCGWRVVVGRASCRATHGAVGGCRAVVGFLVVRVATHVDCGFFVWVAVIHSELMDGGWRLCDGWLVVWCCASVCLVGCC